jgi:hypothetical protein
MRELVRGMCSEWAVSIRQACGAIGFDRSTFHYQSRRTDLDLPDICGERLAHFPGPALEGNWALEAER